VEIQRTDGKRCRVESGVVDVAISKARSETDRASVAMIGNFDVMKPGPKSELQRLLHLFQDSTQISPLAQYANSSE
jgi:hypothetical protein